MFNPDLENFRVLLLESITTRICIRAESYTAPELRPYVSIKILTVHADTVYCLTGRIPLNPVRQQMEIQKINPVNLTVETDNWSTQHRFWTVPDELVFTKNDGKAISLVTPSISILPHLYILLGSILTIQDFQEKDLYGCFITRLDGYLKNQQQKLLRALEPLLDLART